MDHINPAYNNKTKSTKSAKFYAEGIRSGDRYLLSEAITLAESQARHKKILSEQISKELESNSAASSIRIAISGSPGAGKSTLIEKWGLHIIQQGMKVAVLAIDPSSSVTHGSILGDKTRMNTLGQHPDAYIRPSAAGLTLGGVHQATRESIRLCEYAGYDVILIETVGVGQSETLASQLSDVFILLLLPGAGDEIQGIKRGIVELADIVIINKADNDRKKMATHSVQSYSNALSLFHHHILEWVVPVTAVSALYGYGLEELWIQVNKYITLSKENGTYESKRIQQDVSWLHQSVTYEIKNILTKNNEIQQKLSNAKNEILSKKRSAHTIWLELQQLIQKTYNPLDE